LAPEDTPVQVSSRAGSTTAKRELIRARPFLQVNGASTATPPGKRTSVMAGATVDQSAAAASICHTRCGGAAMLALSV